MSTLRFAHLISRGIPICYGPRNDDATKVWNILRLPAWQAVPKIGQAWVFSGYFRPPAMQANIKETCLSLRDKKSQVASKMLAICNRWIKAGNNPRDE